MFFKGLVDGDMVFLQMDLDVGFSALLDLLVLHRSWIRSTKKWLLAATANFWRLRNH